MKLCLICHLLISSLAPIASTILKVWILLLSWLRFRRSLNFLSVSLSLILDSDLEGPSSLLFALSVSLDQKLLMVSLLDHLSVCLKPSSSPFSPDEISFNQTAWSCYIHVFVILKLFSVIDFEDIIVTVSYLIKQNKDAEFWCTYQERR